MKHLLASILLLMSSLCAHADERFLPYLDWLVENTDFTYEGQDLPTIAFLPYAWLELEVYGPDQVARAEFNGTELPKILGAYKDDENLMLFPEGTDPWEREDVVVHELFHFLQHINGVDDSCIPALERPAYEAHWEWVKAHGKEDVYEEPNWLFVYMLEMVCREPSYERYR